MDINKKIEEIRSKPEHERLRYVWGAVIVSMFFILLIWIFSIKLSFQKNQDNPAATSLPDFSQELQNIKQTAPSLKDVNLNTPTQKQNTSTTNEGISL